MLSLNVRIGRIFSEINFYFYNYFIKLHLTVVLHLFLRVRNQGDLQSGEDEKQVSMSTAIELHNILVIRRKQARDSKQSES